MPDSVVMIEKRCRVEPLIHIMKHSMATCTEAANSTHRYGAHTPVRLCDAGSTE